ncbi:tetratricopeptide repeat protein [Streptomyces sp. NPDC050315]|uniref:tetratricopeptide repeat protein n=1 Tax=Streptomyces sp. NPDC050315 TaxID=3155039 RepID=UPI003447694B
MNGGGGPANGGAGPANGGNDARAEGHSRIYQASGDQHIIENHYYGGGGGQDSAGREWSGLDSVRWPSIGRAPSVLRDRTELMTRLRAAVAPDSPGSQVYVLHGLGGCGKTAVAYTLFQYATSQAGRIGLWVNASDTASLRTGMLAVAADRGAGEGELTAARSGLRAAADLVWDHLDHSDRPWLLVLDNADDPAVLRDGGWLRTSPRGTVLVTTRQAARHWWPGAELLQLGVLPREDAARVLCDLAPEAGTEEEAAEVADRLGRLPLALTLAGGFLAHQVIDPWTMAQYGRNLDGGEGVDPIELLDQGAPAAGTGDSRHLVSSTWQFSLNALVAQGLPESVTLLRLLACWAGDPLPVSLLSGVSMRDRLQPRRVEVALRGLLDHSLTELIPGRVKCLRTHGVLLNSVSRGTPVDQQEALVAASGQQLLNALPETPQRIAKDPHASLLVPHAVALLRRAVGWPDISQSTVEVVAECLLRLVLILHRRGEYTSALKVAADALELGEKRLGKDDLVMLRLRQRTGRALFRLGRFEESEAVLQQTLTDCPQGEVRWETCLALSRPLWQLNRSPEAVTLVRQAVQGCTAELGSMHPLTLLARTCLLDMPVGPALAREALGGRTLIADCRNTLGASHEITLIAQLNCANALTFSGRPSEALPLAYEALAAHDKSFGPTYPITLAARSLLAQTLNALGHKAEAVEQMAAVVEGRKQQLGPEHPWTLEAEADLARFRGA